MIPSSETKKIQIELLEEPPKAATMIHDLLVLVLQRFDSRTDELHNH